MVGSRPTNTITDNVGQVLYGHNGGVWEWTDTEFKGYEGFIPSVIYPGYSADFFDGKHFVVVRPRPWWSNYADMLSLADLGRLYRISRVEHPL
jgi:formylglycine-generating enzyme required for sulfatase activity